MERKACGVVACSLWAIDFAAQSQCVDSIAQ